MHYIYEPISLSPIHRIDLMHNVSQSHFVFYDLRKSIQISYVRFIYLLIPGTLNFQHEIFRNHGILLSHRIVLMVLQYVCNKRGQFEKNPDAQQTKLLLFFI